MFFLTVLQVPFCCLLGDNCCDAPMLNLLGLMNHGEWEKVIILGDDSARKFSHKNKFEFISVDLNKKIQDLKEEFSKKLKGKISGMETALSIASGDGKEHMALISALINLPVG